MGRPPTPPFPLPSRRHFLLGSGATLLTGLPTAQADEPARVPPVEDHIRRLAAEAPLRLQFRGRTADDCRTWQAEFASRLRTLLGPHQPPDRWSAEVERTVELKDHRREELV